MWSTIFLFPFSHTGMLGFAVSIVAATVGGVICDVASCCCANHSTVKQTYSFGLEVLKQYLHESSSAKWHAPWIQLNWTLMQWSFTMQCGSYGLKHWRLNEYFFIFSTSTSTYLMLLISYTPIRNGRVGQGAFFFHCRLAVKTIEIWYAIFFMTSTSKENFGKTCGGFSELNTLMNVPSGEAYQFVMPNNAFIASSDM